MRERASDRRPSGLRRLERRVDEQIRELAEAGELSGLPGEGAPLGEDDPHHDEGWAARHIMRNAEAAPEWVDLRREIDERLARIRRRYHAHREWLHDRTLLLARLPADRILETSRATAERDVRIRTELEQAVGEANALIRRYDLLVIPPLQLPLVTLERLAKLQLR